MLDVGRHGKTTFSSQFEQGLRYVLTGSHSFDDGTDGGLEMLIHLLQSGHPYGGQLLDRLAAVLLQQLLQDNK